MKVTNKLLALLVALAAVGVFASPAAADVTSVGGGAFGVSATGPITAGPLPAVTLPATGGTVSSSLGSVTVIGLLSAQALNVSSTGTLGPGGSVTSSASLANVSASLSPSIALSASAVSSTCTATETGVSGSTSIVAGSIQIGLGAPVLLAASPAPNTIVPVFAPSVVMVVLNRQTLGPDGTLTVDAVYIRLLSGQEIILAQSRCRVVVATSVQLRSASAARTTRGVLVRWRTGSEVGLLGFHVYRERAGERVRLTRTLIRTRGGTFGAAYSWLDRRAPRKMARYWIRALRVDGSRTWLGPLRPG